MKLGALSLIALGLFVGPMAAFGQSDFEVYNPFIASIARDNFQKCFPDVARPDIDKLAQISYFAYETNDIQGCPPGAVCDPRQTYFRGRRIIQVKTSELNPSNVASVASSRATHGCSPTSISDFHASISRKRAEYSVHANHEERICTFLGDITLGSGEADISFGAQLNSDFSVTPFNEVRNESHGLNVFGFLLAAVGLSFVAGIELAVPTIAAVLITLPSLDPQTGGFLSSGIQAFDYGNDVVQKLGANGYAMTYATAPGESGFRLDGDEVSLEIFQDGYLSRLLKPGYLQYRKYEIDFIKDLSEVGPGSYTVRSGDSWWSITKGHYGDPFLFTAIAAYNRVTLSTGLNPDDEIKLPRWHELCEDLKFHPTTVRKGESLWIKAKLGQIPFNVRRIRHLSKNPNLIFPFEHLEVLPSRSGHP